MASARIRGATRGWDVQEEGWCLWLSPHPVLVVLFWLTFIGAWGNPLAGYRPA
jgi:hypothetical protein